MGFECALCSINDFSWKYNNFENIIIYATKQHQKWNNSYIEHFPQHSKVTPDRAYQERGRRSEYGQENFF